jgi:citrate lyase subunit beta / citryl-CoA lyase
MDPCYGCAIRAISASPQVGGLAAAQRTAECRANPVPTSRGLLLVRVCSGGVAARVFRPRRATLAVPGSNPRFVAKARELSVDEVFLDLEDAVAGAEKERSRGVVAAALRDGDWGSKIKAVRINGVRTGWAYRDVIDVVEQAGRCLDAVILPKVAGPLDVGWLDLLLSQVEQAAGLEVGRIAIEVQIEDAAGLASVDAIAAASPRLEALIFGPADFMASMGMRSLTVGAPPAGYAGGDAFHYAHMRILTAARAAGLQAIDGPFAAIADVDGLAASAASAAALGFDGKWVLHPGQIEAVSMLFAPTQAEYDRAELIIEAYEYYTGVQRRGAAMLDGEMIDEASRRLALVTAVRGRAAGLARTERFKPPS